MESDLPPVGEGAEIVIGLWNDVGWTAIRQGDRWVRWCSNGTVIEATPPDYYLPLPDFKAACERRKA